MKNRTILVVAFLFSLLLFLVSLPAGFSPAYNNFNVTIVSETHDLTKHEAIFEVQNLDPTTNREFDVGFFINNTNFDLSKVENVWMHEWKPINQSFSNYSFVNETVYYPYPENITNFTYPANCWNDTSNTTHFPCNITQMIDNPYYAMKLTWKPTKMALITHPDKVSADYGNITIPKLGSDCKVDDFNGEYDCNGTKRFKVSWETPIVQSNNGWGSSGYFAVYDPINNMTYDPWWNTTWQYRRNITINNTQNSNTLTDYQVAINITYDSDMRSDFSDLRFTWYNSTSGTEIEIPYWIENKSNSNWAYIWVKVPSIPASSTATVYVYYGNTTVVNSASNATATWNGKVFAFYDFRSGKATDYVSGYNLTCGSGVTFSSNGATFTTSSQTCYYDYVFGDAWDNLRNLTVYIVGKIDDTAQTVLHYFDLTTSPAGHVKTNIAYNSGTEYWRLHSASGGTITITQSWTPNTNWHGWIAWQDAVNGVFKAYKDNALVGSTTWDKTYFNTSAEYFVVGGIKFGSYEASYSQTIKLVVVYSEAITTLPTFAYPEPTYSIGAEETQVAYFNLILENYTAVEFGSVSHNSFDNPSAMNGLYKITVNSTCTGRISFSNITLASNSYVLTNVTMNYAKNKETYGNVAKGKNVTGYNCNGYGGSNCGSGYNLGYAVDGDITTEAYTTNQQNIENYTRIVIDLGKVYKVTNITYYLRLGFHDIEPCVSATRIWVSSDGITYWNTTGIFYNLINFGYTRHNGTVILDNNIRYINLSVWGCANASGQAPEYQLWIGEIFVYEYYNDRQILPFNITNLVNNDYIRTWYWLSVPYQQKAGYYSGIQTVSGECV